ncbi:hypothetical protein D0868_08858 [Hortaea werneckii]|uniref:BRCT domain-containing protein n=1 Tax=Hortaea werneckii TaxID=91943 RepID=A0A3M7AHR0_HORWE|nr:hypothetical protein D0868_08858 [Hortaea werneckii]RMY27104.1 hypothetical protein D0866_10378 [Hortaea werneckii]
MVSTRRTAPTEPEAEMPPDLSNTLRKKPVRRAMAKKTEPETKPKNTRSKKTTGDSENESEANAQIDKGPAATQTKPTRGVGRPRKQPTPASAEEPATSKPAKATRSTATTRAKKNEVAVYDESEANPTDEPKPARRTRGAAPAGPPLSPKKITQVSKPVTRNKKATEATGKKAAPSKPAPRTRTARQRGVSDENADVPDLAPSNQDEINVAAASSTPIKRSAPAKRNNRPEAKVVTKASKSSRPSTPSDLSAPKFEKLDEESKCRRNAAHNKTPEASEDEEAGPTSNENSDDELCGPKTPMKRGSPGAFARYQASVQKTVAHGDVETPMESPRRFANRMNKRGTPKTQKPYNKPDVPASAVKPMTVARGSDRAFVFKDLRNKFDLPQDAPEDVPLHDKDQSFSRNGSVSNNDAEEMNADKNELDQAAEHDESMIGINGNEAEDIRVGQSEERPDQTADSVDTNGDIGNSDEAAEVGMYDEDTVVITQDPDDSLLAVEQEAQQDDLEMHSPASCTPETLDWDNLRQDTTIPINFDEHLAGARVFPQIEPTERLSVAAEMAGFVQTQRYEEPAENAESGDAARESDMITAGLELPAASELPRRQTLDRTVDLNEFVDFAALAEPTATIQMPNTDFGAPVEAAEDTLNVDVTMGEAPEEESLHLDTLQDEEPSSRKEVFDESLLLDDVVEQVVGADRDLKDQSIGELHEDRSEVEEAVSDEEVPHYALPTLSFDARRKSLPAFSFQTPTRVGSRPTTSDGHSMPRLANPFSREWRPQTGNEDSAATPRPSSRKKHEPLVVATPRRAGRTPNGYPKTAMQAGRFQTPVNFERKVATVQKPAANAPTPRASSLRPKPVVGISTMCEQQINSPSQGGTPVMSKPSERYPQLGYRPDHTKHANTVVAPARFRTPTNARPRQAGTAVKAAGNAATPCFSALKAEMKTPSTTTPSSGDSSPSVLATPTPALETPTVERYPRRPPQEEYQGHANTVAAPKRFKTPVNPSTARAATARKAATSARTPRGPALEQESKLEVQTTPAATKSSEKAAATPTPAAETPAAERFPRLPAQQNYDEHANTVAAPARFRTPAKPSPRKAPSTVQKPGSLRKVAAKNQGMQRMPSHTPVKTPLKPAAAMTPGFEAMTPHPSAPLRSVVAMVEVFTLEGASASAPFVALLNRLGAKTTKLWSERVTHVIFKDGSPTTLQRVRLHNKDVQERNTGNVIHCVNSRWVSDCDAEGRRVDEADEAYAVDIADVPRGGKRRRKSMEPTSLVNVQGNVVRDRKRSFGRASIGRSSLGRSPIKYDSPEKRSPRGGASIAGDLTPGYEKENTPEVDDFEDDVDEPATPAYLAAPDKLIQQTAPINRMKKLDLNSEGARKNRRLSYFPTRA